MLFPYFIFMQHNMVVPEILELKLMHSRNDLLRVVALVEHAERENEHRKLFVNALQAMVAAFIDIDYVTTVRRLGFSPLFG